MSHMTVCSGIGPMFSNNGGSPITTSVSPSKDPSNMEPWRPTAILTRSPASPKEQNPNQIPSVGSWQIVESVGNIFMPSSSPVSSTPVTHPPFLPLPGQEILQRILYKSKLLLCVSEWVSFIISIAVIIFPPPPPHITPHPLIATEGWKNHSYSGDLERQ